jgi:hypothetical protein
MTLFTDTILRPAQQTELVLEKKGQALLSILEW